ncbi:MAG: SDR family oxidoreductase [Candidatus Dadabacteria bacterium]|nr:SDR family oxidoreductase [Candidatus Dadabacteria bacterium]NIS08701.1 SDR family oxidoreductase [Candidatus Dadabacteria bacterium]NIV42183.1 DUF2867 domain-containing protein [Candidatus Dadabacteria bacterium]NIX15387.1 DUF2867 domain-containing protein [Candidatus Dadabacteria bacterium]NIY22050.1 DUF2867 domain-containing protein [Candidatus Dadabacteria bacterium]
MKKIKAKKTILITGASGYIGGRLLKTLQESTKYEIKCLARKPEYLKSKVPDTVTIIKGDVLNKESLEMALAGIDTAFYLIHSMGAKEGFEEKDREGAENFVKAAENAGVRRIIYLGGLGDSQKVLSPHLKSRHETGEILRSRKVQVIEFRASVVIGTGSLSFEIIRALVEKLPVMTTPKWVYVDTQPIAISDLLKYLTQAISVKVRDNKIFEIGCKDVVSYGQLMQEYARQRGLKRYILPVPVLTPWLSSLWLGLVTPVYARIGRKIIDSLKNPTLITDKSAKEYFDVETLSVSDAIKQALAEEEKQFYENRWSDSLSSGDTLRDWGGIKFGTRIIDSRRKEVNASVKAAFLPIRKIGGQTGWYYADWLWRLRGFIDLLAGGVGTRRARRDPDDIVIGDVIDWWRVEDYKENKLLRLFAEMKLPGRAWLQLEVEKKAGKTYIKQTAIFDPVGLGGLLYWYTLYPLHAVIFNGMLNKISKAASDT